MPTVAVVQSGTEVAEHPFADTLGFFAECCSGGGGARGLTRELEPLMPVAVYDEDVQGLLKALDRGDVECVVLSSNCLYSPRIAEAVAAERAALERHVARGGGLIVLPQPADELAPLHDAIAGSLVKVASERGNQRLEAHQPEDIMLRFPERVDLDALDRRAKLSGPERLYWATIDPDAARAAVVLHERGADQPVLVRSRSGSGRRVVFSAVPFDWHRERALARNALYFATSGQPFAFMIEDVDNPRDRSRARFLTQDGGAVVRQPPFAPEHEWLLREVDVCLVPPARLGEVHDEPAVAAFLRGGGTLAAIEDADRVGGAPRITLIEGNRTGRRNVELVVGALAAAEGWGETKLNDPVGLRAILACLHRGRRLLGTAAVPPLSHAKAVALTAYLERRLKAGNKAENVVALGARLDSLALIGVRHGRWPSDVSAAVRERATALGPARSLQLAVSLALVEGRSPWDPFLERIDALEAAGALELRDVAGWAMALAMVDRVTEERVPAALAERLGTVLAMALDLAPPGLPWLNADVTAEITMGIAALVAAADGAQEPAWIRLRDHVSTGQVWLRRMLEEGQAGDGHDTVWRARVSEAVLVTEHVNPLGLDLLDERRRRRPEAVGGGEDEVAGQVITALRDENLRMAEELRHRRAQARGPVWLGYAAAIVLLLVLTLGPWVGVVALIWSKSLVDAAQILGPALVVLPVWALLWVRFARRHALLPAFAEKALGGAGAPRGPASGS